MFTFIKGMHNRQVVPKAIPNYEVVRVRKIDWKKWRNYFMTWVITTLISFVAPLIGTTLENKYVYISEKDSVKILSDLLHAFFSNPDYVYALLMLLVFIIIECMLCKSKTEWAVYIALFAMGSSLPLMSWFVILKADLLHIGKFLISSFNISFSIIILVVAGASTFAVSSYNAVDSEIER